ncbi:hypothetical protein SMI01S_16680 [Sphingobacterium mizutaii NBRC 14946 = DSM 11724]|uniref:Uncharacterized protein n=2 Tax=Sphingobacterium mizutaii TaxID=1010 RepID=A0AAJ4X895_9SPHI|nr:hypothetical protein [Sphingobacterium mizutaii]GEM68062.1 hypothetical protein SMI01S_16680 [Sphingobacterium mizutaii NBRC 14946 = DSM 11724]SDL77285.1 hypothetical protein SAMN05192578_10911 [Sphingobacterium mizutaii]SNV38249.1 Uncharacterised protein [Sphingobacterium mizutaii]
MKIKEIIKKNITGTIAIVIALGSMSFTMMSKETPESTIAGHFYRYTSSSLAQPDIENINNYKRIDDSCEEGSNVCGVYLATDKPANSTPVPSEFNAVKSQLWSSQQSGEPANADIKMKE